MNAKSNHKYTKSVSICCMVGGDSAEKFSSLRSDDCQAFFVKALIPVSFASGESHTNSYVLTLNAMRVGCHEKRPGIKRTQQNYNIAYQFNNIH